MPASSLFGCWMLLLRAAPAVDLPHVLAVAPVTSRPPAAVLTVSALIVGVLTRAALAFWHCACLLCAPLSCLPAGADREVQRILMELLNQMDGFDQTVNVKVIMATNRADTLDPALLRPGRLDRKIEFPLPDRRQKRLVFQVGGWVGVRQCVFCGRL